MSEQVDEPLPEEGPGMVLDLDSASRSPRDAMEGIDYTEQLIQDENGHAIGSELEFDEVDDAISD